MWRVVRCKKIYMYIYGTTSQSVQLLIYDTFNTPLSMSMKTKARLYCLCLISGYFLEQEQSNLLAEKNVTTLFPQPHQRHEMILWNHNSKITHTSSIPCDIPDYLNLRIHPCPNKGSWLECASNFQLNLTIQKITIKGRLRRTPW